PWSLHSFPTRRSSDLDLEEFVRARAAQCCEYCCMPQELDRIPFELDHIIALVHGGAAQAGNLALSYWHCNCYKGPNLAGIDPSTDRKSTRLNSSHVAI